MTTDWVFDSEKLEAAMENAGLWLDQKDVVRGFLHSEAAAKLRVTPSPPSESPGLRPQPEPRPDALDVTDG
jgi:hypothetical protein